MSGTVSRESRLVFKWGAGFLRRCLVLRAISCAIEDKGLLRHFLPFFRMYLRAMRRVLLKRSCNKEGCGLIGCERIVAAPCWTGSGCCGIWKNPNPVANLFLQWGLFQKAEKQGIRVMLCGIDGDTVVSHGFSYLTELAAQGDWQRFSAEATALSENFVHYFPTPHALFQRYGRPWFQHLADKRAWPRLLRDLRDVPPEVADPQRVLWRRYVLKAFPPQRLQQRFDRWHRKETTHRLSLRREDSLLAPRLRQDPRFREVWERRQHWLRVALTEQEEHEKALRSGFLPLGVEMLERATAAFQVELRYPFFDQRLIEFCLALHPRQKLQGGWTRWVFRQAMQGILPPSVQWRKDKSDLSANTTRALLMFERPLLDRWILGEELRSPALDEYVDFSILKQRYRKLLKTRQEREFTQVWFALMFGLWLEYFSSLGKGV